MRVIAVTSGKGGVGKSSLSANLAITLAAKNRRVVVFDADLGLANLDVILGVNPRFTLEQVVSGERTIPEVLFDAPGGIRIIPGGSGVSTLVQLSGPQLDRFLSELNTLAGETDYLIFDTGAGIDDSVMTFLQAADEVLLVVTPDPSSITDAYATAKTLFSRQPAARVRVVMNAAESEEHARLVFDRLSQVAQQYLGKSMEFAGWVRHDPTVVRCARRRQPFVLAEPQCGASRDVGRIAENLLGIGGEKRPEDSGTAPTLVDRLRALLGGKARKIA